MPFGLQPHAAHGDGRLAAARSYDAWLRGRLEKTIAGLTVVYYSDGEAGGQPGYFDHATGGALLTPTGGDVQNSDTLDTEMGLVFYPETLCALTASFCSLSVPADGTLKALVEDLQYASLPAGQKELVNSISGRMSRAGGR